MTTHSKGNNLEERINNVLGLLRKATGRRWHSTVDVSVGVAHTDLDSSPGRGPGHQLGDVSEEPQSKAHLIE